MMKWVLGVCVLLVADQLLAQQIVWEKVLGSDIVNYEPNDLVVDSNGDLFLVGRYETGLEFFKTVDGIVRYADTTLPHGTHPFVQKLDGEGNLLKQIFLPGIEAKNIVRLNNNRLAISGFMNGYREKNYDRDRTQGVFLMLLDSNLRRINYLEYPSYYNSTPFGMIPDQKGGVVIAARSFTKPDPNYTGDEHALRLIHADERGVSLCDTTFLETDWFLKNKFKTKQFEPTAITTDSKSIWFCASLSGRDSTYRESTPSAIVQLDFYHHSGSSAIFSNRERFTRSYESSLTGISASGDYVFVVGQDLHQKPDETYVFLFDSKGQKMYQKSCKGDFGEAPLVAQISDTKWAVLSKGEDNRFLLSFFDLNGLVNEVSFKQENCFDPKSLILNGNQLYCVGETREGGLRKTWISKVRMEL